MSDAHPGPSPRAPSVPRPTSARIHGTAEKSACPAGLPTAVCRPLACLRVARGPQRPRVRGALKRHFEHRNATEQNAPDLHHVRGVRQVSALIECLRSSRSLARESAGSLLLLIREHSDTACGDTADFLLRFGIIAEHVEDQFWMDRLCEDIEIMAKSPAWSIKQLVSLVSGDEQDFALGIQAADCNRGPNSIHRMHYHVADQMVEGFRWPQTELLAGRCRWRLPGSHGYSRSARVSRRLFRRRQPLALCAYTRCPSLL